MVCIILDLGLFGIGLIIYYYHKLYNRHKSLWAYRSSVHPPHWDSQVPHHIAAW